MNKKKQLIDANSEIYILELPDKYFKATIIKKVSVRNYEHTMFLKYSLSKKIKNLSKNRIYKEVTYGNYRRISK